MTMRLLATVNVFQESATGELFASIKQGRTPYRTTPFATRRGLLEHVADRLGDHEPLVDVVEPDTHAL